MFKIIFGLIAIAIVYGLIMSSGLVTLQAVNDVGRVLEAATVGK